jgi:hypothetical protein
MSYESDRALRFQQSTSGQIRILIIQTVVTTSSQLTTYIFVVPAFPAVTYGTVAGRSGAGARGTRAPSTLGWEWLRGVALPCPTQREVQEWLHGLNIWVALPCPAQREVQAMFGIERIRGVEEIVIWLDALLVSALLAYICHELQHDTHLKSTHVL